MTNFEVKYRTKANRYLTGLLIAHVPVLFVLALAVGSNVGIALLGSILLCLAPCYLAWQYPSSEGTSIAIGAAMMGFSGLLIYLGNGRLELHFHVFSFLAVLAALGSLKTQLVAAATIAVHHVLGWIIAPRAVFSYEAAFADVALHAFFVVVETVILAYIATTYWETIHTRGVLEEQIGSSAESLAAGSGEIADFVDQFAGSIATQAQIVDRVAQTGDQMRREMESNLGRAQRAAADFDANSDLMILAQKRLDQINSEIGETSEQSKKISGILSVMTDIARQINLLAVNASIEASRNGAGSGFGVIADQVRFLAEKTSAATRQIDELIGQSVERLGQGSHSLNDLASSFSQVTSSATRVREVIDEITQLNRAQVQKVQEIATSMQQISQETQSLAGGAKQTAGTSRHFVAMAGEFRTVLADLH